MFKIGDVVVHRNDENFKAIVIGFDPISCMFNFSEKYSYNDSFYDNEQNWILLEEYNGENTEKKECRHTWERYTGFTDRYQYCSKCDTKRGYDDQ